MADRAWESAERLKFLEEQYRYDGAGPIILAFFGVLGMIALTAEAIPWVWTSLVLIVGLSAGLLVERRRKRERFERWLRERSD